MTDKPEAVALKPCPFCGGEPTLDDDTMGHSVVCCYHCYAQAGFGPEDDAAITKWNNRAQPDASALVEVLRKIDKQVSHAMLGEDVVERAYQRGVDDCLAAIRGTNADLMQSPGAAYRACVEAVHKVLDKAGMDALLACLDARAAIAAMGSAER